MNLLARASMRLPALMLAVAALSACASERITQPAPGTRASVVATDVVYYLDGREITAKQVEAIDPTSIESVEVLKGESARRMLGDRAAYGVVMIVTKAAPAR